MEKHSTTGSPRRARLQPRTNGRNGGQREERPANASKKEKKSQMHLQAVCAQKENRVDQSFHHLLPGNVL
ncbi:hypothetical protein K0M31_017516 [Melipona bicolor]|uniref:Uncharacterized protein n=1 Tax=Melipona bicolor TaxID=60889 RepID=A0AA40G5I2_9HYME|nr:hypothetical protein K0M31_017516 [Melipona bicolor]